ncbi:MAG: AraC family transcriptional regulator [Dorea sp.]
MSKKKKPKMEFRYYQMSEDSPILALLGQKWVQTYGREIDYLHFHNYLEIGYCYEGHGIMTLGEEEVEFSNDQFTVIPRNFPHTTNSTPGTVSRWEYLFVDVERFLHEATPATMNGKRVEHIIKRIDSRAFLKSAEESPKIAAMIRQILDVMRETNELYLAEAKGILMALLVNIIRENDKITKERGHREEIDGKVTIPVSTALDYITLHYMETIKIEDLAAVCHMSEAHFRRLFVSYMKMSPLEYINQVRIQTACEYLKKTDASISDIAHKCGFSTLSTFNRNFKQIKGVTPGEWRKRPENFEQQLLKFEIHSEEGW